MAMLNVKTYPDERSHPNRLFGQPTKVLHDFEADIKAAKENGESSGFVVLVSRLHDILVLFDRVYEEAAMWKRLGKLGRKKGKENQKKHPHPAVFAEGRSIERRVCGIGLPDPIFAAFRANVSPSAWAKGEFEWIVDPEELLGDSIDQMCEIRQDAYQDNNAKPADVGKKQAAYLGCYQVMLLKLARMGKLESA